MPPAVAQSTYGRRGPRTKPVRKTIYVFDIMARGAWPWLPLLLTMPTARARSDPRIEASKMRPCAVAADAKCKDWCAVSAKETHCRQCE